MKTTEDDFDDEFDHDTDEQRHGVALIVAALIIPFVTVFILCFISEVLPRLAITAAMFVVTTALVSIDADRLGVTDRFGRTRENIALLAFGMILLWVFVFPIAIFRRSRFAPPNLGFVAIGTTLFFVIVPFVQWALVANRLPGCNDRVVVTTLDQVVRSSLSAGPISTIDGHRELSYDSIGMVRNCECTVHSVSGDKTIRYVVEWQDRKKNLINVRVIVAELPSASSAEVMQLLEQMVRRSPIGGTVTHINGHREISFDSKAQVRVCQCVVHRIDLEEPITYRVEWQDQVAGRFLVRLPEPELPSCVNPQVASLLETVVRSQPGGAAITAIDGHRELEYDAISVKRLGECTLHSNNGEITTRFIVEWTNKQRGQFQVRLADPDLPTCDNAVAMQLLEQSLRTLLANQGLKSVDGHVEKRFDQDAQIRYCECTAHLESGDKVIQYVIEWQVRKDGRFQVRITRL